MTPSLISQVLTTGGSATIKGRPSEVREQQHFPSPLCCGKHRARAPCTTKPAPSSGLPWWARGGLAPANCRSSISSIRSWMTKEDLAERCLGPWALPAGSERSRSPGLTDFEGSVVSRGKVGFPPPLLHPGLEQPSVGIHAVTPAYS